MAATESEPAVSVPETVRSPETDVVGRDAVPETYRLVVVALVKVALLAVSVVAVRSRMVPTALSIAFVIVPVMLPAEREDDTLRKEVAFAFSTPAMRWR